MYWSCILTISSSITTILWSFYIIFWPLNFDQIVHDLLQSPRTATLLLVAILTATEYKKLILEDAGRRSSL